MKQPPYTPEQVLENIARMDGQLKAFTPNLSRGPGWVRGVLQSILKRGIASDAGCSAALEKLLARYTALVNCGDCGNWNPEDEDEVKQARAALAMAKGTK